MSVDFADIKVLDSCKVSPDLARRLDAWAVYIACNNDHARKFEVVVGEDYVQEHNNLAQYLIEHGVPPGSEILIYYHW